MRITRPSIDLSAVQRRCESAQKLLDLGLANVPLLPRNLTYFMHAATTVANCRAVLSPESQDIWGALKLASQAHAAFFALASSPDLTATVPLGDGEPLSLTLPTLDSNATSVFRWLRALCIE